MYPKMEVDVKDSIVEEIEYQGTLVPERADGRTHTVGEEVLLLLSYAERAKEAWVNNCGDIEALNVIRKCAAICVRCMQEHGVVYRCPHCNGADDGNHECGKSNSGPFPDEG